MAKIKKQLRSQVQVLLWLKRSFLVLVSLGIIFTVVKTYQLKVTRAATINITCAGQNISQVAGAPGADEFQSGDDLVLTGDGTCVLTTAATLTSLTVGNGSDATVLTHQDNTTSQQYWLDITTTGNINVTAGASIDVDGRGYVGNGAEAAGNGPGAPAGRRAGAGHGGNGGSYEVAGGTAYCDISDPDTIGSSGGGGYSTSGADGGGLIVLNVGDTLNVSGSISAKGNSGTGGDAGGGAGGGIKIVADTITGAPALFSASGGDGNITGTGGGAGGGGCAYIEYTTASSITDVTSITMGGGTTLTAARKGGAGVVLIKQTGNNGDLYVTNAAAGEITPQVVTSLSVDSITLDGSAIYNIPVSTTLTVPADSDIIGNNNEDIEIYGDLESSGGTIDDIDGLDIYVYSGGAIKNSATLTIGSNGGLILYEGAIPDVTAITTLTSSGTLTLEDSVLASITDLNVNAGTANLYADFLTGALTNLTLNGGTTTLYDYTTLAALSLADLIIESGATLNHGNNSTAQDHIVNISASNDITINGGGSVNVDGLGYDGGDNEGNNGYGPFTGMGLATGNRGGGGAHGGDGGNSTAGSGGGVAYCSLADPDNMATYLGSGGAAGYQGDDGGAGGGLIMLSATNTITVGGTISAVGEDGGWIGAAGAGGGVRLYADTIAGAPSSFNVAGGDGPVAYSGGGGGGCVYISYTTSNSISSSAGYFDYSGGTGYDSGEDGEFLAEILTPTAPTTLYSNNTNNPTGAQSGDSNPVGLTDLTPVFSAICNTVSGTCDSAYIEVDDDSGFGGSPEWQSGPIDIVDTADSNRIADITYAGGQLEYATTYYWRIRFANGYGTGAWSDGTDTFYVPRSIELLNFNYGGVVQQGQSIDIQWMSYYGESNETVKLEYSTDDFATPGTEIAVSVASTSSASTVYTQSWTIPAISSSDVKIRISSNNDGNNYTATSENTFTIQAGSADGILSGNTFDDSNYFTLSDPLVSFSSGDASYIGGEWYDLDWAKRTPLTITNSVASELTDYQVKVVVTYDVDMQADFDDIRFTTSDKETLIDHWLESKTDSTTAAFWVEVPTLAASEDTIIYMYYGNGSVSTVSSIANTFVFGDDFENYEVDSAIDGQGGWTARRIGGAPTGYAKITSLNSRNHLSLRSNSALTSVDRALTTTNDGYAIRTYVYADTWNESFCPMLTNGTYDSNATPQNGYEAVYGGWGDTQGSLRRWASYGANEDLFAHSFTGGNYYTLEFQWNGSSLAMLQDDVVKKTRTDSTYSSLSNVGLDLWSGADRSVDWFLVRKFASTEPSVATGSEEVQGASPSSQFFTPNASHFFTAVSDFSAHISTTGSAAVKFQISNDDGSSWNYCVADTLIPATLGYAESSPAADITNDCLDDLSAGGDFNVRTYLYAGAGEIATISDVSYLINTNYTPTVSINSAASKTDGSGAVDISIELDDNDLGDTLYAKAVVRSGVDCSSGTSDPTIDETPGSFSADSGTPTINNAEDYQVRDVSVVDVGSNTVNFDWLSQTDFPTANGTYCVRVTPYDDTDSGTVADTTFTLDNVAPTPSGNFALDSIAPDSLTYTLGAAGSDTNLDHYDIYYKAGVSGVTEFDTLHTTIAAGAYFPTSTTTINALSINDQYATNIWTYDAYGNKANATELASYTGANTPGSSTVNNPATTTLDVTLDVNSNPSTTAFAIQETGGNYVQAGGSLGPVAVWQTSNDWGGGTTTVNGLGANVQYTFQVKAKNGDDAETVFGGTAALYTLANIPGTPALSAVTTNSFDVTLDTNGNPANPTVYEIRVNDGTTDYYVQADGSLALTEAWQTNALWGTTTVSGLIPSTTYTVDVRAKNGDDEITAYGGTASATTADLPGSPTIFINSGAVYSNNAAIALNLSATDATEMYISGDVITAPSWISYSTTHSVTLTSGDGAKTVSIKFRDVFLNETSTVSDTIILDTTAPTTTASPSAGTYDSTQSVTLTCSDITSGCNQIYYTADGSTPTTSSSVYATPISIPASTDLKYFATDNVGNSETIRTTSYIITIEDDDNDDGDNDDGDQEPSADTTPPTIADFSPAKGAAKISPNTTVSFRITDADSGINLDTLSYAIAGTKTGTHTNVLTAYSGDSNDYQITLIPERDFSANEQVTLAVTISDNAGNEASLTDHVFMIRPASEPGTRDDEDPDTGVTIQQAKRSKTTEDTKAEQAAGIIDDGANIAVADLTYDGTKEIIAAPRHGAPYINIYSREGIILTPPFLAYDRNYTGGVNITVADLDGSGQEQEIITSPMAGSAHIRIFNRNGQAISSFMAREASFRGNTIVKVANLEGSDTSSGDLELIILCSDGILKVFNQAGREIMTPVKVFLPSLQANSDNILFDLEVTDVDNSDSAKEIIVSDHNSIMIYGKDSTTQKLKQITPDIIPFDSTTSDYNQGIVLSAGDLDGTAGELELVVGSKQGSSLIKVFNKDGKKLQPDFYAYDLKYVGGIGLTVSDLDGTGGPMEIITIAQRFSSHVRIFNKQGQPLTTGFMAYPEHADRQTAVTAIDINSDQDDNSQSLLISPTAGSTQNRLFSKDSRLLSPGWYLIGIGEEAK
ncbi:DUF2341 domain-containing protein [Patescibacteria group bacterium]|nr:DUF2341 domain-containing protein [Patescibacteria group bacterium]